MKKTLLKIFLIGLIILSFYGVFSITSKKSLPPVFPPKIAESFRFASLADTKMGIKTLANLSSQIATISPQPAFALYEGDLQGKGFDEKSIDFWKNAMGSLWQKTYFVRGNHDTELQNSDSNWRQFFHQNLDYSFNYKNVHFVGLDCPGDNVLITADQTKWLDDDLTKAEAIGNKTSFLFFHGPIYFVDDHPSLPNMNLIEVINKHPSVKAIFNGHEHLLAHTSLDATRIPQLTRTVDQFITGAAGAETYECKPNRSDFCVSSPGFAIVNVEENNYSVAFYVENKIDPVSFETYY
ncbi:metallophosphoesterase [Candidatus Microgenomates bacterium]|nr:metallophosphoesterase [Candidatus Microgenomates bacterium]